MLLTGEKKPQNKAAVEIAVEREIQREIRKGGSEREKRVTGGEKWRVHEHTPSGKQHQSGASNSRQPAFHFFASHLTSLGQVASIVSAGTLLLLTC